MVAQTRGDSRVSARLPDSDRSRRCSAQSSIPALDAPNSGLLAWDAPAATHRIPGGFINGYRFCGTPSRASSPYSRFACSCRRHSIASEGAAIVARLAGAVLVPAARLCRVRAPEMQKPVPSVRLFAVLGGGGAGGEEVLAGLA